MYRQIIGTGLLLLLATVMLAQNRPPADRGNTRTPQPGQNNNQERENRPQEFDEPDTFGIYAFYALDPEQEVVIADTTLATFHQFDPTRLHPNAYRHLGVIGSAHTPMIYQPTLRRGFAVGQDQYELYFTRTDEIPFFRLDQPYTDFQYIQGEQQPDGYISTRFARKFSGNTQFTLDYKRINEFGADSHYPSQLHRITALAFGLWSQSKNQRYESFITVAANTAQTQENGGLISEPAAATSTVASSPASAVAFLPGAKTRIAHRDLGYTQYYRIGGGLDTTGRTKRAYTLSHRVLYQRSRHKFWHDSSSADSSFMAWFPHLFADSRGIRQALEHQEIANTFSVSTSRLQSGKAAQARQQRDGLKLGITHRYHRLRQAPLDTILQNLLLHGNWRFQPSDKLALDTYGQFDLGANAGDYQLRAKLLIQSKKAGAIRLDFLNQLSSPTFLETRLFLNEIPIYQTNFDKTLLTSLSAAYTLSKWQLQIKGSYQLINNYIYFDQTATPKQLGSPVSIGQLTLEKNFKFGPVHLDNRVSLQQVSESELPLPSLLGFHSLYYQGFLFKNLEVRLGGDLRYTDSYFPTYYNPVVGQFILQDRQSVPSRPALDAFFSMRVTKFRFFVRLENIAINGGSDYYYLTPFYPLQQTQLRLGLRWILRN